VDILLRRFHSALQALQFTQFGPEGAKSASSL
jgi:hypothetical protein